MPGEPAQLRLHVPEPTGRPGQATDFSYLRLSAAGEVPRPAVDIVPSHTGTMAWKLIRVLDDEGRAVGPWAPQVEVAVAAARTARDAAHPRLRRAHADRAAAEEDLVLHAVPGRGGHRGRACAGAAARRHVLSHLPPAGPAAVARRHRRRRADVPAAEQRARPDPRPPAAGDVLVQARRLLLDLGQPGDAVRAGGRLGHGLGDQAATPRSPRAGSATARPPRPTSTTR